MLIRVSCVAGPAVVAAVTVLIASGTVAAREPASAPSARQPAVAQESASAPLAQQLAAALNGAQLDSIAAKDSQSEDLYVAALFFPGRLLVVSARMEAPVYVDEKIALRNYRDVYIDLNTAAIANTKLLITDGGADGLRDGDPVDSVNPGDGSVMPFSEADANYARMLQVLLTEVN